VQPPLCIATVRQPWSLWPTPTPVGPWLSLATPWEVSTAGFHAMSLLSPLLCSTMVVTDRSVGISPVVWNRALHPMSLLHLTLCPTVVVTGHSMRGKHCRPLPIRMPCTPCPCSLHHFALPWLSLVTPWGVKHFRLLLITAPLIVPSLSPPLCPTMVVIHHFMGDKATWLLSITMPLQPYPYSLPFCPTILLHLCLTMSVTGLDGLSAAGQSAPYAAWCLAHQQQSVLANICRVCAATGNLC